MSRGRYPDVLCLGLLCHHVGHGQGLGGALPLTEIMFLRILIAIPFFLVLLLVRGKPLLTRAWKLPLVRSVFGITAMFCFYYALTHMPLTDVVFIGRCQSIILTLLAPPAGWRDIAPSAWIAIVSGLAGAALVMRPGACSGPCRPWWPFLPPPAQPYVKYTG